MAAVKDIIDLLRYRVPGGIDEARLRFYRWQIDSWIEAGLDRLVERLIEKGDEAKLADVTQEFPGIAVTSGVIDLSGASYKNIKLDGLRDYGHIKHATVTAPWTWVRTEDDLMARRPLENLFVHWTLAGRKIVTKNTDGSLTSLGGTVTIKCPTVPGKTAGTVNIHDSLIPDLVDILEELYWERATPELAAKEGERL